MNTNTVFKFEFVSDSESNDRKEAAYCLNHNLLNANNCLNDLNNEFNCFSNSKLDYQFSQNLNYQLKQQLNSNLNQQKNRQQFNQQLNKRLTQHLNSLNKQSIKQFKINKSNLKQKRLINFFLGLFNYYLFSYYQNFSSKLNAKIINFANFLIYYLQFLITDLFHYFIFKFLLNASYQKVLLLKWLNKVTKNQLIAKCKLNSKHIQNDNFIKLFGDGKLLCGLINYLNKNACSRYDLLDSSDAHTNLDLAYRLLLTYYRLDEKNNLVNLNEHSEFKLIDLISKIRYIEIKRELCARYEIDNDQISHNSNKNLVQDNYLIKGMGLFVGTRNRVSFFNIFYFKFINICVEIEGPNCYGFKRIKIDNFKLIKPPKKLNNGQTNGQNTVKKDGQNDVENNVQKNVQNTLLNNMQNELEKSNRTCSKSCELKDKKEIPLKCVIKKQLIEISYIPIQSGVHKISIVHHGHNILSSPYIVKIDDCI